MILSRHKIATNSLTTRSTQVCDARRVTGWCVTSIYRNLVEVTRVRVAMGSFYSTCANGVATAAYGEGRFLELRVEETTILLGIIGAGLYCTAVYLTIWTAALPIRMLVSYSWDVVIASMLALIGLSRMSKRPPSKSAIAALPEAEQEKAKKQLKAAAKAASLRRTAAMALCATVALVRWYFGSVREALRL